MDIFGSNATPMGGSAGRADAMVGAVEAQKVEGVLHLHLFLFLQMAFQCKTLAEIADMFRRELLQPDAWKRYIENVRRASYPDVAQFEEDKSKIEAAWPAYAQNFSLSRPPASLFEHAAETQNLTPTHHTRQVDGATVLLSPAWLAEGTMWAEHYNHRLQHVLSHMNHHIHPLNQATGERKPLKSCCRKDRPHECKGGFPLDNEMLEQTMIVCACLAAKKGWTTTGPRSVLGGVMPARNEPWLNPAPSAWSAFTGDNGDIKFPHKVPIIPETHEKVAIFCLNHSTCATAVSDLHMIYDLTASMSMAAGYFGGYTSKMQDIGTKELQHMREALERKVDRSSHRPLPKEFQEYTKRLLKDLEAKSMVRTAVETLNLSIFGTHHDVLQAECIRTFPTVTYPAAELLRREEVETQRKAGKSIIVAVHHNRGEGLRSWTDPPFDLLYGFRGCSFNVDLLSSYEMLRYWRMEKVLPPNKTAERPTATWTSEGRAYLKKCKDQGDSVRLEAGVHYIALDGEDRILLPDLPALRGLRHRWFWQKRSRPHVPFWNFAKMPRPTLPAEENSRLLSLYMRPWTLNPQDATSNNPLLTDLRKSTSATSATNAVRQTYKEGWRNYIDGNVVSEANRTFIQNLLMATAARVIEDPHEGSSDDESDMDYERSAHDIGSLDLVQNTLRGIAVKETEEDGQEGFGQYDASISLGRSLWQSADLTPTEVEKINLAEADYFLTAKNAKDALEQHVKEQKTERQAPFDHATDPSSKLLHTDYVEKLNLWFATLSKEKEVPNPEQMVVLQSVRDRLLTEVELSAVGCKREDPREEPMRGLIHGLPGTGKSRVIQWIIRMFTEAMAYEHGREFVCVAFQNKVAHAMNGCTLHNAGEVKVGQQSYESRLESRDIDSLYTKNQNLRWVLFDEVFMIPDDLLGIFAKHFQDAAPDAKHNRYFQRSDGTYRWLGGTPGLHKYTVTDMLAVCIQEHFRSVS